MVLTKPCDRVERCRLYVFLFFTIFGQQWSSFFRFYLPPQLSVRFLPFVGANKLTFILFAVGYIRFPSFWCIKGRKYFLPLIIFLPKGSFSFSSLGNHPVTIKHTERANDNLNCVRRQKISYNLALNRFHLMAVWRTTRRNMRSLMRRFKWKCCDQQTNIHLAMSRGTSYTSDLQSQTAKQ